MKVDFATQSIKLGIRDFCEFGQNSYPSTPYDLAGNWRTQLGHKWHQQLWAETQSRFQKKAQAEVSIKGTIEHQGWSFEIQGRIDQIIEEDCENIVREVKTTSQILPLPVAKLQSLFPSYFEQVACYLFLKTSEESVAKPWSAELLFLHIETGIHQTVPFTEKPLAILGERLDAWVAFLEFQKAKRSRVERLTVPAAFSTFREEQIPARERLLGTLDSDFQGSRIITFQAPTGFGKTSLAIEWALKALKSEHINRILFLTGKSTGQEPILNEFNRFQSLSPGIRYFQIRNLDTHIKYCPHLPCACSWAEKKVDQELRANVSPSSIESLIEKGSPEMEAVSQLAKSETHCPRLITQSSLIQSECWIADYNYVFSRSAAGFIETIPTYTAEDTLLIIDEAHNLHDRVCSNHSCSINPFQLRILVQVLNENRSSRMLAAAVEQILNFCQELPPMDRLELRDEYLFVDLMESFRETLNQSAETFAKLEENEVSLLWDLCRAHEIVTHNELKLLFWKPEAGHLQITCIDSASVINAELERFGKVLMMSATFPPEKQFEKQTGLSFQQIYPIVATSPWRNDAYQVAIDARVDTRYKKRDKHYLTTADTISLLTQNTHLPIVVFFPSYQYAATIKEYLQVSHPHLRAFTMERGLMPMEQLESIQLAIQQNDVLLLPLGSGFSEGIDFLGGRTDTIMIVSPSLPEVNPVQKAKSEAFSKKDDAFRSVYLIPGINKVNQALGRIVRSPEHTSRVLLHCERFFDRQYLELLAEEYQDATVIRTSQDLLDWIRESS